VLRAAGETAWPVRPLATPPLGASAPADLAGSDAVRLFVERARAARPDFALRDGNAAPVAELCRRLDGIPLALELAAAQLRVLPVGDLLGRLEDRFLVLTGGSRTALPRQQTLAATLDWSYALLGARERTLLARLAVFAGGWTLAAAEAVAGDPDAAPAGPGTVLAAAVLEVLTRLVDRSLVVAEEDGEGHARFRMLETLRDYARERLAASGEADTLARRHLAHYTALAEAAAPELEGPAQRAWLARLEREHDNCRAALRWALDHPTPATVEHGLRLADGLGWFWVLRGHVREAGAWLDRLLAAPEAAPTVGRAKALAWSAFTLYALGDPRRQDVARARLRASLDMFREAGAPQALTAAFRALLVLASWLGDTEAARVWFTEGLERFRQADDANGQGQALLGLGGLALEQGDHEAAVRHLRASLAAYRRAGNQDRAAGAQHRLGMALRAAGDLAGSRRCHAEALAVWRELGYLNGVAGALNGLGEVAAAAGDTATARARYEESLAGYREVAVRPFVAVVLRNLALLDAAAGDPAARDHLEEAFGIWRDLGQEEGSATALEAFAAQAAARGQAERALRLAGAADALRAALGRPRPPRVQARLDARLAAARQTLGARAAAAHEAGQTLPMEQVIAEAVAGPRPDATDGADAVSAGAPAQQEALPPPASSGTVGGSPGIDGPLRVDGQTYTVWRGARPLPRPLAAREFALVRYLYERADRVCTRQELGDAVWGPNRWDPDMLYRLVRRVKEKLEPQPAHPRYLQTVPGFGYRLAP
jgi:predicted ATPase